MRGRWRWTSRRSCRSLRHEDLGVSMARVPARCPLTLTHACIGRGWWKQPCLIMLLRGIA